MQPNRLSRRSLALGALAGLLMPAGRAARGAEAPVVAAASDLDAALPEIAALFRQRTGRDVRLVFGASGNLAQQIRQGAPFALFLSADESYVQMLAEAGRTDDAGTLYAIGRIGIFAPAGSPLRADSGLRDLAAALGDGRLKHFAIANPEHAPYGRAARQALEHAGLWDQIVDRLVLGENVAQATQFAAGGAAQGGIIPLSTATNPAIAGRGSFALLPEDWHQPLRQRMALLTGADATARAFYAFMQQPPARAILARFGFVLPGASS